MAKKSISKSVRMTEDLYGFIMKAPGNGFNEKFENIVLRERLMQPEIDKLQKILDEKRQEVYQLTEQYHRLDEFFLDFQDMYGRLGRLRRMLESAVRSGEDPDCDE